jgi:Relaxase/Mobilisation nuclease domain
MTTDAAFDLFSYARRGPSQRTQLSPAELATIRRTISRTPEVMVKVLSRGAVSAKTALKHVRYIARNGEVDLKSDSGDASIESLAEHLDAWDLDLEESRPTAALNPSSRKSPRLIHKIIFSMPPGTPSAKVLSAVQNFAREEFALKYRYLLALHTDEPHPHVHLVVKAMSEQGHRLNIRKATLEEWRSSFAQYLRDLGVAANASRRSIRGVTQDALKDGIYRAAVRGKSTFIQGDPGTTAEARWRRSPARPAGRTALLNAWHRTADALNSQGQPELARQVLGFIHSMTAPAHGSTAPPMGRERIPIR